VDLSVYNRLRVQSLFVLPEKFSVCPKNNGFAQLSQESDTLNRAIDQLPKRLMMVTKVKGGHVKFRLD